MKMDSATGSIYLEYPSLDRHHRNIRNTKSIFPCSWSHALLPRFGRSTQSVWFIMAGYPFISSHPLPTLLELELLFLRNSFRIPCEVRQSVYDGLSAFSRHRITTPWSSELRDALRGCNRVTVEIHLRAVIEWTWRCTPKSWSTEWVDALGGHDHANLDVVIERVWRP